MNNHSSLLMDTSILYRSMQKYYDKQLSDFDIGAGQLLFLISIYENEGISMQALANKGSFDKGTITKGIAKLEEQGYVRSAVSVMDKRMRLLYTTEKTKEVISNVYLLRNEWWERISKGMSMEDIHTFERIQRQIAVNARDYGIETESHIRLFGLQKLSLLDYPGKMASTIFTGGCNFRCPFCHNRDLVFIPENTTEIQEEDILQFLKKRANVLEGVCISGGEPLLQDQLEDFLRLIKKQGYAIKLDTNGSCPERLKKIVEEGLVDYIAMDIKNSPSRYGESIGIQDYDMQAIDESIQYILKAHVPYEFRTTIVKEFHGETEIREICKWIKGAKAYFLQNFEDGEQVIQPGLHACSKQELEAMLGIAQTYIENTKIRGI